MNTKVNHHLLLRLSLVFFVLISCGGQNHQNEHEDVQLRSGVSKYNNVDYYYCVANPNVIKMISQDEEGETFGSIGRLESLLHHDHKTLLFAMNGGMFTPDTTPVGLYVEEKELITPRAGLIGSGNFNMGFGPERSNGVFVINDDGTAEVKKSSDIASIEMMRYATQSGPLLLYDGVINPNFGINSPNRVRRNGVGVTRDNDVVMIMADNVTFYELSSIFRDVFDCDDAVYMDGVVSRMFIKGGQIEEKDGNFAVIIYVEK